MDIQKASKKFIVDKLKERDELNKIKKDAFKEAYKKEIKIVATIKGRQAAHKPTLKEQLIGTVKKVKSESDRIDNQNRRKKKRPSIYDDDEVLAPSFKKAFE